MSKYTPVTLAFTCCIPKEKRETESSPIVLVHGLTSSKERWSTIQQDLADKSKRVVYSVDARNHGESEKSDFFNFDVIADDLMHFLDSNKIDKAIFIGHSMGGLSVMNLALKSPEKVEMVIAEDVSPKEPVPELYFIFSMMIEEQIRCFERSTITDTYGSMQQKLRECVFRTVPMIPDEDQEVIGKMEFQIQKTENGFEPLADLKSILKAVKNPPICTFPEDKEFNGNALFIYGCQSNFIVVEDKELIYKYFPKAQFSGFETAAHEICARHPQQFVEKVCDFLC